MAVGDITSNKRGSGTRFNDDKPEYHLIPLFALAGTAQVLMYGKKKYTAWDWAKGMPWSVCFDCALRHLTAWQRGEENDPESGLPHLDHALCNLIMLAAYRDIYPEGDNRPAQLAETGEKKD